MRSYANVYIQFFYIKIGRLQDTSFKRIYIFFLPLLKKIAGVVSNKNQNGKLQDEARVSKSLLSIHIFIVLLFTGLSPKYFLIPLVTQAS